MYSELWEYSLSPPLALSLSLHVCVCVRARVRVRLFSVRDCAFSMCDSYITEWEDAAAHKGVQVVNLMNEHGVCR